MSELVERARRAAPALSWCLAGLAMFFVAVATRHRWLSLALPRHAVLAREALLYAVYLAIAVGAVVVAWRRGWLTRTEIGIAGAGTRRRRIAIPLALGLGTFAYAVLNYTGGLLWAAVAAPDTGADAMAWVLSRAEASKLGRMAPLSPEAIAAATLGLLGGVVAEEVLYRGLVTAVIRRHFGAVTAVVIGAAVFAAAHATVYGYGFVPWHVVTAVVFTTVFVATRNLGAAIATHLGLNAGNFVVELWVLH